MDGGAALEVGGDLLDDGVTAMHSVRGQGVHLVCGDGGVDTRPAFHGVKEGRAALVRGVGAQEDHPSRAGGPQPANGSKSVGGFGSSNAAMIAAGETDSCICGVSFDLAGMEPSASSLFQHLR